MDKYSKKKTISLEFLQSHQLGDDFVLRMLDIYLKDIPKRLEEITNAIKQNDNDTLRIAIHTLGSHTRDLGASEIHSSLLEIEDQDILSEENDSLLTKLRSAMNVCKDILVDISAIKKEIESKTERNEEE